MITADAASGVVCSQVTSGEGFVELSTMSVESTISLLTHDIADS